MAPPRSYQSVKRTFRSSSFQTSPRPTSSISPPLESPVTIATMYFSTKVIALFSLLASSALASDVFSAFLESNGAEIGSTQFDVGNPGCFSVTRASQISFSQAGPTETANGPYCLVGYAEGGCPNDGEFFQQFMNVDVTSSTTYQLNTGLNGADSYKWINDACPS